MRAVQVIVLAKRPVPGRVKTRLTPPYRPEQAAALARTALADTVDVVARTRVVRRVLALEALADQDPPPPPGAAPVCPGAPGTGGVPRALSGAAGAAAPASLVGGWLNERLPGAADGRPAAAGAGVPSALSGAGGVGVPPSLSGAAGAGVPASFDVFAQRGGGLDERLAHAFADAYAGCRAPMVLIGMDTPQVTPGLLDAAAGALDTADAVLGPAADGGFWLLGLRRPDPDLLLGVPMSTVHTGAVQRARLIYAGLRLADAPRLRDVDTAEDAASVAAAAPHTTFAATHAALATAVTGTPVVVGGAS